MKDLAMILFLAGVLLIIHSIYEEKNRLLKEIPKTDYKFIPRNIYFDQFFVDQQAVYNKDLFS